MCNYHQYLYQYGIHADTNDKKKIIIMARSYSQFLFSKRFTSYPVTSPSKKNFKQLK